MGPITKCCTEHGNPTLHERFPDRLRVGVRFACPVPVHPLTASTTGDTAGVGNPVCILQVMVACGFTKTEFGKVFRPEVRIPTNGSICIVLLEEAEHPNQARNPVRELSFAYTVKSQFPLKVHRIAK